MMILGLELFSLAFAMNHTLTAGPDLWFLHFLLMHTDSLVQLHETGRNIKHVAAAL